MSPFILLFRLPCSAWQPILRTSSNLISACSKTYPPILTFPRQREKKQIAEFLIHAACVQQPPTSIFY